MGNRYIGFLSPRLVLRAGRYAWQGLCYAIHERAFKLELVLTPLIIAAAIYLAEDNIQRALLISSWLLVPMVELLNTAVEKLADRIATTDNDPLIGQAKDLAAAAVLWSLVIVAIVWLCILLPVR